MDFLPIRKLYHCNEIFAFPEDSIQAAVKRFGRLPNTLIEYYRQLGANSEINQVQDCLCGPGGLTLENGHLTFYVENQEAMWWTIKQEDLGEDNPAVYACLWRDSGYVYLPERDPLEKFLYSMAYCQSMVSLPWNSEGPFVCNAGSKSRIEATYEKKDFGLLHAPEISFYGNDEDEAIMLCDDGGSCQVSFACTTERQFEEIKRVLAIKG
ncbi:hypothetical protein AALC17_08430 [Oscillospiraceae bacterium 38-13]|jgi:hypothetical protein